VDIGIGLPNTVPGTEGRRLVDWAKDAEEAGFSTLGTIGRLVYPNYEELIALSAAAAVTSRIRLTTSVLLAPLYANTALFAKGAGVRHEHSRTRSLPPGPRRRPKADEASAAGAAHF
jgi:alkanesulfonate monooxygenase SsuD/methylene tetrahydromethanopterin reductase-like flavin-dependent oxidoreductase (luciferase family)